MNVISNASPLITLARIGQLDLLRQLYSTIIIPEAVWHEVVVEGAAQPGAEVVSSASWIVQRTVTNRPLVHALRQELDAGEAEAIALAVEIGNALLLMDERLGRDTARYFGIRYTGIVGVLIEAKHKGFVKAIHPYLDALCDLASFRLSEALYRRVLHDEGEISL
jgi:predicted nucleic acid-binding protein